MHIVLGPADPGPGAAGPADPGPSPWRALLVEDGRTVGARDAPLSELPGLVRSLAAESPRPEAIRWVWSQTARVYPPLLAAGFEPARCWDLSLCQRILSQAAAFPDTGVEYAPVVELDPTPPEPAEERVLPRVDPAQGSLFDSPAAGERSGEPTADQLAAELAAQLRAVTGSRYPQRLTLLLAGESQGGMIAVEMHSAGLPWRRDLHEALLAEALGPRPADGARPARMQELADRIAATLQVTGVNPDSQPSLLKALHTAGIPVRTTSKWDLMAWAEEGGERVAERRALIAELLEYKTLQRLWTANGWHWLDAWVRDGRFHPSYAVGGVVTGRWAAHGGGAMQVPATVRGAVRADPGWLLTVADASQVEPRILAAMSGDRALAQAGRDGDMYLGVAELGRRAGSAVSERSRAKIALLGAMYGSTTGDSGALVPHLRRLFPAALEFVESAARIGERGGRVATWLGRTSPAPGADWQAQVADVSTAEAESRARSMTRSHGRFTRNFVIQGTAAEWALCWMGAVRRRLHAGGADGAGLRTRLVFFVHDEVVLHGPAEEAEEVRTLLAEAAAEAGRLLFGRAPVEFPLTVSSVESYAEAK